jgi:hypothetical protein
MKRFISACQMFWIVLTKPELFQVHLMKTVQTLFEFLEETAKADKPMTADLEMNCVANITIDGDLEFEKKKVLVLWCGVADCPTPIHRIREMRLEIDELKKKLNSGQGVHGSVATEAK